DGYLFARKSDLFLQLAIQRLLRRLALAHTALRKLPATTASALSEEYLAGAAHQDDADIGSITLRIDPVVHDARFTGWHAAEQGSRESLHSFPPFCQTMRRALASVLQPAIRH